MKMRKDYKDLFLKKHNLKLGFMSPFLKASSVALEQMPTVNAGEYIFTHRNKKWLKLLVAEIIESLLLLFANILLGTNCFGLLKI